MTVTHHPLKQDPFGWKNRLPTAIPAGTPPTEQEAGRLIAYFQRHTGRLKILATTITPAGQILDWIQPETQCAGQALAAPPAPPRLDGLERGDLMRFELEDVDAESGPRGAVPVLRRSLSDMRFIQGLSEMQRQRHRTCQFWLRDARLESHEAQDEIRAADFILQNCPDTQGAGLFRASGLGGAAGQLLMLGRAKGASQCVEAGLVEMPGEQGGWIGRLFTYFSARGFGKQGDRTGGYNQIVRGWVQVSQRLYPGAVTQPMGANTARSAGLHLRYQLYQGNWWLAVNGEWCGYYPAGLFQAEGLRERADMTIYFGRVEQAAV
jgi:hypothetical protein